MKDLSVDIKALSKSLNPKLYQDLIVQLNKDLLLGGIKSKVSENIEPLVLVSQLNSILENLIKNDYQAFGQFMYTLDVSEIKIKAISETALDKLLIKLTDLVLERLIQKVVLKAQFKSN